MLPLSLSGGGAGASRAKLGDSDSDSSDDTAESAVEATSSSIASGAPAPEDSEADRPFLIPRGPRPSGLGLLGGGAAEETGSVMRLAARFTSESVRMEFFELPSTPSSASSVIASVTVGNTGFFRPLCGETCILPNR